MIMNVPYDFRKINMSHTLIPNRLSQKSKYIKRPLYTTYIEAATADRRSPSNLKNAIVSLPSICILLQNGTNEKVYFDKSLGEL